MPIEVNVRGQNMWLAKPENAWITHIKADAASNSAWIEDSSPISKNLAICKRELFGLIILAHACSKTSGVWRVGFDANDEEPNDGFIAKGKSRLRIEHKVVAQTQKEEVLEAILSVYKKSAKKGDDYGKGRILVIHPNKAPSHGGLIKISDLTKEIDGHSPFDKVITIGLVSSKKGIGIFHLIQHYPPLQGKSVTGSGITQVDFDYATGQANLAHEGFSIC